MKPKKHNSATDKNMTNKDFKVFLESQIEPGKSTSSALISALMDNFRFGEFYNKSSSPDKKSLNKTDINYMPCIHPPRTGKNQSNEFRFDNDKAPSQKMLYTILSTFSKSNHQNSLVTFPIGADNHMCLMILRLYKNSDNSISIKMTYYNPLNGQGESSQYAKFAKEFHRLIGNNFEEAGKNPPADNNDAPQAKISVKINDKIEYNNRGPQEEDDKAIYCGDHVFAMIESLSTKLRKNPAWRMNSSEDITKLMNDSIEEFSGKGKQLREKRNKIIKQFINTIIQPELNNSKIQPSENTQPAKTQLTKTTQQDPTILADAKALFGLHLSEITQNYVINITPLSKQSIEEPAATTATTNEEKSIIVKDDGLDEKAISVNGTDKNQKKHITVKSHQVTKLSAKYGPNFNMHFKPKSSATKQAPEFSINCSTNDNETTYNTALNPNKETLTTQVKLMVEIAKNEGKPVILELNETATKPTEILLEKAKNEQIRKAVETECNSKGVIFHVQYIQSTPAAKKPKWTTQQKASNESHSQSSISNTAAQQPTAKKSQAAAEKDQAAAVHTRTIQSIFKQPAEAEAEAEAEAKADQEEVQVPTSNMKSL